MLQSATMLKIDENNEIWTEAIKKTCISQFEQTMFLDKLKVISIDEGNIKLLANSNMVKESFKNKLSEKIGKSLSDILNTKINFEIEVVGTNKINETNNSGLSNKVEVKSYPEKTKSESKNKVKNNELSKEEKQKRRIGNEKLNETYTFDTFVISENNSFAANAAKAIVKNPGKAYNPFLIYGGVGLGKTHLMEAIGNELLNTTKLNVIYIPTEDFMNEFLKCLSENKMQVFKKKYRSVDILLLDDIQFFQKKDQLQNEFFYTFNHLYDTKKQMVFTCDRPPSTLENLADRLKSRFEQGLSVDLKPPSFETRCAILQKKLEMQEKTLEKEIIELIAQNISSNVRDLNAALIKLLAFKDITKENLTLEKASTLLKDSFSDKKQQNVSLDKILKAVAEYFEIGVSDIRSKKRNQKVATARHYVFYLATEMTQMSTSEIGAEIGNRAHSTVLHSCQSIEKKIIAESGTEIILQELKNSIQNLLN